MREDDFERRRRALEEQLEKDLELVREAHRVKLRALDDLRAAATGEPPKAKPVPIASEKPKRPPRYLAEALEDVWDQLPAEFDKEDLYRLLGHQPPRATLDRAITELLQRKKIVVRQTSVGWHRTRYQKVGGG